jgi:site-specific recombinase XerD
MMVKTYMANRGNEGVSNSTINNEVNCLKCILSRAVEWEYIEKNPLLGLKMLQEPPPIVRYLTSEGAKRLLAVSPQYLREVLVLALGTGMRKSEIFTLTWKNIKINEIFRWGEITVIGKGNKQRNIRINKTVYNLLIRKSEEKTVSMFFHQRKLVNTLLMLSIPLHQHLKKPVLKISDFMIFVILQLHGWFKVEHLFMLSRKC